jgi:predicted dehydrogenase
MSLRYALIGPGEVADRFLLPALHAQLNLICAGLLGRTPGRTAAVAARHGIARVYATLAEVLADGVDAAVIASPDELHYEQALPLLRAGVHVFVEKPLATAPGLAHELVTAAQTAGVQLAVGYHHRFHAGHVRLAAGLAAHTWGELRHIAIHWAYPVPRQNWRQTSLVGWWSLAALGTHALDQIAFLTGTAPAHWQGRCHITDSAGGPKDETALVSLVLPTGVTAQVCVSARYRAQSRLTLYTESSVIECVGTFGPRGAGTIHIDGAPLEFAPTCPYQAEFANWLAAIRTGQSLTAPGQVGWEQVELLHRLTLTAGV